MPQARKISNPGLAATVVYMLLSDLAGKVASGKEGQAAGAGVKIAGGVMLRYSRENEYQADELGIRYMEKAGYNPWGMPGERMAQAHEIIEKDYKNYSPFAATCR